MAKVLTETAGMSREAWLAERRKGIGGSDAAAIAGLNRYRSQMEVYLDKLGELDAGDEDNEAMYWGRQLEDLVAEEFQRRTEKKVWRRNAILQHPEHEFMIANIDRRVVGEAGGIIPLECKTTSAWLKDEWEGAALPDAYAIQVHHYIAVCGAPYAYVAVLIGGNTFRWQKVERDEELLAHLIQIERDFWHHHVLAQTPPALDGSEAASEFLKALYPEAEPESRTVLPPAARELIAARERWKKKEDAAAARRKEAENRLKDLLGDHEVGLLEGEPVVRWQQITSSRTDTKKLKREYPEVAEACSYQSSYRRFSIHG